MGTWAVNEDRSTTARGTNKRLARDGLVWCRDRRDDPLADESELEQGSRLMEAVCERGSGLAYQQVMENKGAAGVDVGVVGFKDHLKQHWPTIKARILGDVYGGHTETARGYQDTQDTDADGSIDPAGVTSGAFTDLRGGLSGSSYGFRRGRNAHQAVKAARQYVAEAADMWWIWTWRNFSTGSADILMEKLSKIPEMVGS